MSLNQIYYNPNIPFEVSNQSNIKANLIKCNDFFTNTINGLPINGGNVPMLQPGDEFKILNSNAINQAAWTKDLGIRSDGSINFDRNSKMDADKTLMDIYNESIVNIKNSKIDIDDISEIIVNNSSVDITMSAVKLINSPITTIDSDLTITSSTSRLDYGIITPKISFAKSGSIANSAIDFYQFISFTYRVFFQYAGVSTKYDTEQLIDVTFCRIGKLVNVSFNNIKPFKINGLMEDAVGYINLVPEGAIFEYLKPLKPTTNLIQTFISNEPNTPSIGYYVLTNELRIQIYRSVNILGENTSIYFNINSDQVDIGLVTEQQTFLSEDVNFHCSYYALDA